MGCMNQVVETRVVLFADIAGSTELYEVVGDIEAHRQVTASLELMAEAIFANNGQLLRTVGDSSLASFTTADDAFLAASDMQRQHDHTTLSVRVGFHLGEVIPDKGDVYGMAVNIAARVASFARIDEIAATHDAVQSLSSGFQNRATFIDRIDVKGIVEPVSIYNMAWKASEESATVVARSVTRERSKLKAGTLKLQLAGSAVVVDGEQQSINIGRANDASLPVNNEHASRYHAVIEWRQGQFLLTDQSTNGTYIRKEGRNPLFLRRESTVLEGKGTIGVGILPELDKTAAIDFDVEFN